MNTFVRSLDAHLSAAGTDVTLRRVTGSAPVIVNHDVVVRARADTDRPEELTGGIMQARGWIIISPTHIAAAGWPGTGEVPNGIVADPSVPREGDKVIVAGVTRNVELVEPTYIGGELVRIRMRVL